MLFHILCECKVHFSSYSLSDFKMGILDNVEGLGAAATFMSLVK